MSVNVGDKVRINTASAEQAYHRFDGQTGVVTGINQDGASVLRDNTLNSLYFFFDELEVVPSTPAPKVTLDSIYDVYKSTPEGGDVVENIKALLEEAGYNF